MHTCDLFHICTHNADMHTCILLADNAFTCNHTCNHTTRMWTILYTCMQTPRGRRAIVEEDSQATAALNRSPSKSLCGCFGTISFPAKAGNTFYNKSLVERGGEKSTYIYSGKELYIYICDRTDIRKTDWDLTQRQLRRFQWMLPSSGI